MFSNLNPSDRAGIAAVIDPAQAGPGTITTPWVDARTFFSLLAIISVGVLGAGATVDAKFEQATVNTGADAKAVPGSSITQIVKATGDSKQALINIRPDDLDKNGGFKFVRLSVTVGGAASFLSALLLGFDPRYGAAGANQTSTVAQTVR
ncbi:hypothetical protein [Sphingomonas sanguinis]|uniref:Uncharacterized protein n=1 Tax=Sphingomonas sanguinis TaxID=33051 RepID=A0A147IY22_9SPHN|nr:hypothetical protein [Sphingomonas sanguinis]KTW00444.1 hypothetical protein SB4_06960 [Sphingomonas sanguinis]